MPSICCLHDLDTFPGFSFSPEVLGHQQIVGYQNPLFWLIFRHIYLQSLSFPKKIDIYCRKDTKTFSKSVYDSISMRKLIYGGRRFLGGRGFEIIFESSGLPPLEQKARYLAFFTEAQKSRTLHFCFARAGFPLIHRATSFLVLFKKTCTVPKSIFCQIASFLTSFFRQIDREAVKYNRQIASPNLFFAKWLIRHIASYDIRQIEGIPGESIEIFWKNCLCVPGSDISYAGESCEYFFKFISHTRWGCWGATWSASTSRTTASTLSTAASAASAAGRTSQRCSWNTRGGEREGGINSIHMGI